jgi:hypothetical protein
MTPPLQPSLPLTVKPFPPLFLLLQYNLSVLIRVRRLNRLFTGRLKRWMGVLSFKAQ